MKHCEKCNLKSKPKDDFYDQSLRSQFGVVSNHVKVFLEQENIKEINNPLKS